MTRTSIALLALLVVSAPASAQHPLRHFSDGVEMRVARSQPIVHYVLRVPSTDRSAFEVEVRLRNVADTFRLAMATHPEYDDRYWRYLADVRIDGAAGRTASINRLDSALWRVTAPGGEATVRYRIRLPAEPDARRAAWRPFLAPTGGLVGGPHAFMYVVGATLAPAHVTLELPSGWEIATGLAPTSDPRTFFAPSIDALIESPMLVGQLRTWRFTVDGVPHRIVYWPLPNAVPFDTVRFVDGIERMSRQAIAVFGRAPWREYAFLLQDGALGALEHPNSVTLGVPSASLAENPHAALGEVAHEFFHAWNLMRIRPVEYHGVDYRPPTPSAGLWFSEGMSMFYSDLLMRRAGLPVPDSTRAQHIAGLIARYFSFPGNGHLSAETVSREAYATTPGTLGDYENASTHLQGELLGTMIDLTIRDATDGRRSMDDLMRLMLERFSGERGFTSTDIERAAGDVCGCSLRPLFDGSVRSGAPIDFDRYLRLAGLKSQIVRRPALGRDGQPVPDLRFYHWLPPGEPHVRVILADPTSVWGRAGLHTGDRVASINGTPMTSSAAFRALIGRARIGDTLRFEVARPAGTWRTTVVLAGYDRPVATVTELPDATPKQQAIRQQWMAGRP